LFRARTLSFVIIEFRTVFRTVPYRCCDIALPTEMAGVRTADDALYCCSIRSRCRCCYLPSRRSGVWLMGSSWRRFPVRCTFSITCLCDAPSAFIPRWWLDSDHSGDCPVAWTVTLMSILFVAARLAHTRTAFPTFIPAFGVRFVRWFGTFIVVGSAVGALPGRTNSRCVSRRYTTATCLPLPPFSMAVPSSCRWRNMLVTWTWWW
jgi:hypothetical protein